MQRSTITRRWAAALYAGAAFGALLASGPAHAASSFDGEWTGTGEAPVCQNVGGGAGALASYKGAPVIVVTDGALEGSFGTLKLSGKVAPNGAVSGLGSAGDAVFKLNGRFGEAGGSLNAEYTFDNGECLVVLTLTRGEAAAATASSNEPTATKTEPVAESAAVVQPEAAEAETIVRREREEAAQASEAPARKVAPPPGLGGFRALVIGNQNYEGMKKLATASSDAKAVAETLRTRYGFKVDLLLDATRSDIIGAMSRLRGTLNYDESLLIYYAGHGVVDEVTERGYWLPVDADPDSPANWVSNDDITNMLKAFPARAVMVIADSCYSGSLLRDADIKVTQSGDPAWLKRMAAKRARTVFTSGGNEPVVDGGGGAHSVFAKALLDALKDNTEPVDAQTLFGPVKRQVVLNANQTPEYGDVRMAGHEGGDFVFVPRPRASK